MNRAPIFRTHLVHLVDRCNPLIGKHECARLKRPPAIAELVADSSRGEPSCRTAATTRIYPAGRKFPDVPEELRLRNPGIADEQHMHIPADPRAVRKVLWNAAHQLERKRLLHLLVTIDGWGDRCNDFFVYPGVFTEFNDLFFLFWRDLDLCELLVLCLDRDRVEYDIKERALTFARDPLV
uniref:Uncharacterized protein n=1 Tax=Candidatus Methanogaster sp. ANME-2c ERB4 TaxID=2759911 RepID=A0A7G9YLN9_9EURY|nr:hypothetical protein MOGPJHGO_00026 [Methanosarcinales archaeon ANME-2c ERB4]